MDNDNLVQAESGLLGENINLRQYWHIVLERRWLVITTFVSVFILCLIYLGKAPRIYQASVRLQIDRESENVVNVRDAFAIDGREQDYLQTQYKNLQSRALVQKVVTKLKLDKNDERYAKARDPVLAVIGDLTIAPSRLTRLVDIKVEHTRPEQAAAIANALATQFVEDNLERRKFDSTKALTNVLESAKVQKLKVEQADEALQKYKEKLGNVSLEESQSIVLQQLRLANEELVKVQSKATLAQKLDEEVQNLLKNGASLDSIPVVANDTLIQELKGKLALQESALANLVKRYRDKHPDVQRMRQEVEALRKSIKESAENIIAATRNEAQIARSQELSQQAEVRKLETKQLELGSQTLNYERLKREAESQRTLWSKVFNSELELRVAIDNKQNNMHIVDAAIVPYRTVKPRVMLTLFLGVFGGLAAACGLAFFVNYLDDSIKTQDDVEIFLRLPFLGYVPNIKSNSVLERDLQAHLHPQSTASEGFRTIRTAITLMPKTDKVRSLVITSTIPLEGKSLLASNMAIVMAQTGVKTLLVDSDLRRPSVHKTFQLHSPLGLSSFLQGHVNSVEEIVHSTEVPNLDVVCAGAIPTNPSELVGSKRMEQFLQEAGSRYDRIFMDCPPVSAVSDPLMVSAVADGVLFIAKFNKIRREHARKSLQRIQDAGIHVVGVVLNDIDFEGKDSYYYSYYYYQNRYYASHYRRAEKDKATANVHKAEEKIEAEEKS
jgi:capsular exopolysaccharide synthesis family protein